jgi:hypothetical protein
MTSSKQFNANRQNATLSTGPRSEQGKQVSRLNALTHGLTGAQIVIGIEDPEEFERLLKDLIAEYAPQSTIERQLIERLAVCFWRLKRIPVLEAAIFEEHRCVVKKEREVRTPDPNAPSPWAEIAKKYAATLPDQPSDNPEKSEPKEEPPEPEETPEEAALREQEEVREEARQAVLDLGNALLRDANQQDWLGKLSRHEASLFSSIERTIQRLEKLQEKRLAKLKGGVQIVDLEPDENKI